MTEQRAPMDLRDVERRVRSGRWRATETEVLTLIECVRLARANFAAIVANEVYSDDERDAHDGDVQRAANALRDIDARLSDGEGAK